MSNVINFESSLAEIILFHRKKSGLTQLELARLAGVGKTVVFDIEHAKKSVRLKTLIKILKVLNISIELNSPLMQKRQKFLAEMKEDIDATR
jgi:HTH-type transcriptional regulator / antitoxin HipB